MNSSGAPDVDGGKVSGRTSKRKGLVIVYTGNGKGKTTAAIGLMMRAWGRGLKVVMLQFIKHENARFGEIRAARKMGVEWITMGAGFTDRSRDPARDRELCRACWEECRERILAPADAYDIVVLDEITYAFQYGWLTVDEVLEALRQKPPMRHVVLTGRNAPPALVDYADLVTEMNMVKHPYHDQGIGAQPGIEF
jgi:cob(I)alamin adenosyltransferase